jgi:transcriptional regulator of acetoin/glycerol metabolism
VTLAQRQRRELDQGIRRALRKHGKVREAAAELGIPKSTLYDRARELGIRLGAKGHRKAVRRGR